MILVREVFRLKFGKAKEAKALWKEGRHLEARHGFETKAYVDLTGPFYTLVMETPFESLAVFDKALKSAMSDPEFGPWYQKFVPLVESGSREIYTALE
jgi:hypothetical protein